MGCGGLLGWPTSLGGGDYEIGYEMLDEGYGICHEIHHDPDCGISDPLRLQNADGLRSESHCVCHALHSEVTGSRCVTECGRVCVSGWGICAGNHCVVGSADVGWRNGKHGGS